MDPNYKVPPFALHHEPDIYDQVAASVANVAIEIGEVISSGSAVVDWFNGLVMDIFNLGSGSLLLVGNVLSWNVWVIAPEEVYTQEWQMHADYWRFSLDVNHRSPEGNGRNPAYFNGQPFNPEVAAICNKLKELKAEIGKWGLNSKTTDAIKEELQTIIDKNCNGNDSVGGAVFL